MVKLSLLNFSKFFVTHILDFISVQDKHKPLSYITIITLPSIGPNWHVTGITQQNLSLMSEKDVT
jgi:hypothetical protein